jgi:transposase
MSKQIVAVGQTGISHVKKLFCGIDVGADTLAVAVMDWDHPCIQREFANTVTGHKALLGWLGKMKAQVRVSLEATGIYSMDLALALDATEYVEIAVLNPKRVHDFARTLRRSKTDSADAQVLAEFSLRMPFAAWQKPSQGALAVRAVSRHLEALVVQQRREANRLHAAERSIATPRCVIADLKRSLAGVGRRIVKLRREAMTLIAADANLKERFNLLTGVPGIAAVSALQILGELVLLRSLRISFTDASISSIGGTVNHLVSDKLASHGPRSFKPAGGPTVLSPLLPAGEVSDGSQVIESATLDPKPSSAVTGDTERMREIF